MSADDLYDAAIVWDAHAGFMPEPSADLDPLNAWRDAGVSHLSINVGFDLLPWQHTLETVSAYRSWIEDHGDSFTCANSVGDIQEAKRLGKMAVSFDIEGVNALDGRIDMLARYHHLGVRQILLAYNRNNLAGGGCHDIDSGLTSFGRAVITEMNRLGIVVDLSHCGPVTCFQALQHSEQPVVFSHSNARALRNHERNVSDDLIQACAAGGGVVGAVGLSLFLGEPPATVEALATHVEYLIRTAGAHHVGVGLDYAFPVAACDSGTADLVRANPQYWPAASYDIAEASYVAPAKLRELGRILRARGHSDATVGAVLGGNFMRLAGAVWR
jgi:membrane dipeptidase